MFNKITVVLTALILYILYIKLYTEQFASNILSANVGNTHPTPHDDIQQYFNIPAVKLVEPILDPNPAHAYNIDNAMCNDNNRTDVGVYDDTRLACVRKPLITDKVNTIKNMDEIALLAKRAEMPINYDEISARNPDNMDDSTRFITPAVSTDSYMKISNLPDTLKKENLMGRDIADIYDSIVEPDFVNIKKEKLPNTLYKVPAYDGKTTLMEDNWARYKNENLANGGSDNGLYAYDPVDDKYMSL